MNFVPVHCAVCDSVYLNEFTYARVQVVYVVAILKIDNLLSRHFWPFMFV